MFFFNFEKKREERERDEKKMFLNFYSMCV